MNSINDPHASAAIYADAISQFQSLLAQASAGGEPEPTAMTLATADAAGRISSRIVLLKSVDQRGFVFHTNYDSAKAEQLLAHPQAALCILWKTLREVVQVRVEGTVQKAEADVSDAYFASRARASQIGAWASRQSRTLPERGELELRIAEFGQRFAGIAVPRPPNWGGYRLVPDMIELWFGQRARLHERERFELFDGVWTKRLLYP